MLENIFEVGPGDSLDEIVESIKSKRYEGVLVIANDPHIVWESIKNSGIHIGLRGANWSVVKDIPVITINGVKLVLASSEDDPRVEFFKSGEYNTNIVEPLQEFDIIDLKDPRLASMLLRLNGKMMGWDFETRGFPMETYGDYEKHPEDKMYGFKPLGFSLVSDDYGIYIDFRNYKDYKESKQFQLLKLFLVKNQRSLVTYNCKFEMSCFLQMFGEYIYPMDAMALLACDNVHTNLKSAAQMYLSVPSWDDELDFEQKLLNDYMESHDKTIIQKILDNRKRIDPEADLSLYSSIKDGYGNVWEMCYPPSLAKYCILDGYYTLKLWEKVAPQYSEECIDVFHRDFYHGMYLSICPMPVRPELITKLIEQSTIVSANANAYVNRLYGELLELNYGKVEYDKVFTPTEIKLIESGRASILSDKPDKILKSLVAECYGHYDGPNFVYTNPDESIATVQPLIDVYGREGARIILESGVGPKDQRKKTIWNNLMAKLGLNDKNESIVQRFNNYFNKESIEFLIKFRDLAKQRCPVPIEKLLKYRLIMMAKPEDINRVKEYKALIDFIKDMDDEERNLYLDYVSDKQLEQIINSPNPKYATMKSTQLPKKMHWKYENVIRELSKPEFVDDLVGFSEGNFVKYRDWIPYAYVCDLIRYRHDKEKFEALDNITLYDSPLDVPIYLNITSEIDSFRLIDLLELTFPELLDKCYNQYIDGQFHGVWLTEEQMFNEAPKWGEVVKAIYPLNPNSSFRRVFLDKWDGANRYPQVYSKKLLQKGYYRYGHAKLTLPDETWKLYYYMIQYCRLKFGADKQLSPYLIGDKGFDTRRYKVVESNKDYAVLDKSKKGEGFVVYFSIAEKTSKRYVNAQL